ncbi:MAG: 50S ribosomal protein L7 [Clostridiales bacterium]|jgi:ribosomal protein L7Ae-like RNA K-turn-binding protein|nr:50S ribosomal protein L7 [Clostridiales bacterium]
MNNQDVRRLFGLLGIARRGGKLAVGFDAVAALMAEGKGSALLIADDLSEKTEKELRFKAGERESEIVRLPLGKDEIGSALGLGKPVGILAIDDKGFAKTVLMLCSHHEGD